MIRTVRVLRASSPNLPALIVEDTDPEAATITVVDVAAAQDGLSLPPAPEPITADHLAVVDEWLEDHGYPREGEWEAREPEGYAATVEL